jgi:hypothetical protein
VVPFCIEYTFQLSLCLCLSLLLILSLLLSLSLSLLLSALCLLWSGNSPNFKLDEGVLPLGAAVHASLAASYLAQKQEEIAAASGSFATSSSKEEL